MRKLAVWIICLKLVCFIILELILRIGLWVRYMNNDLPDYITGSGIGWLIVVIYIMWLLVEPIINGVALLIKDRGFLLEHSR